MILSSFRHDVLDRTHLFVKGSVHTFVIGLFDLHRLWVIGQGSYAIFRGLKQSVLVYESYPKTARDRQKLSRVATLVR